MTLIEKKIILPTNPIIYLFMAYYLEKQFTAEPFYTIIFQLVISVN